MNRYDKLAIYFSVISAVSLVFVPLNLLPIYGLVGDGHDNSNSDAQSILDRAETFGNVIALVLLFSTTLALICLFYGKTHKRR